MEPAHTTGKTKACWAVCFICLMLFLLPRQTFAAPSANLPAKILFIPSYNFDYLGVKWFMQGVTAEFAEKIPQPVMFSIENLQFTAQPGNTAYLETVAESLRIKYTREKPDLIIAEYKPAVQFLQQYGRQIFGDVPVVFAGLEIEGYGDMKLPMNFTGITTSFNAQRNIELILKNHPQVKKLYIVAGFGASEQEMVSNSMQQAAKYQDRLQLIPFENAPLEETLRGLSELQPGSAILYLSMQLDMNNKILVPAAVAKEIAKVSRVPVYGMLDTNGGSGITGGFLINHDQLGRRAAQIAAGILQGKRPAEIPTTNEPIGAYTFDWRQLQRWEVDETSLPAGSIIDFRPFSVWEAYKIQIIFGILLLILQGFLVVGLLVTLSRRKRSETALRESEEKYRTLVEKANEGIIIAQEGMLVYSNRRMSDIMGVPEGYLDGKPLIDFIWPEDREFVNRNYEKRIAGETVKDAYDFRIIGAEGKPIWIFLSATVIQWKGKPATLNLLTDVTERVQREQAESHQANHDELTGLYNRCGFAGAVAKKLAAGGGGGALLLVGIDDFKLINEVHGLAVGDQYLAAFAEYLRENFGEAALVGRFGGDEFMLFFGGSDGLRDATRSSDRMEVIWLETVNSSFFVQLSGGIALLTEQESNLDLQIQRAYLAMHHAKESGKWCCKTYESVLQDKVSRHYAIREALNHAVSNEEFYLAFQPIFDIQESTDKIVGYETLLRWTSRELGQVSPAEFVPVAEETNLILPIGKWVLRQACRFSVDMGKTQGEFVNVAVNISMLQLAMPNFVSMVKETLSETGLPACNLSLEVTESILMTDAATRISYLRELHDFGVAISLDDFGTGYSSFTYLAQMPITTIKIDKSMVHGITDGGDTRSMLLLEFLLKMSALLGYRVVGEGVETQEQLIFLKSKGCGYGQGYLLGRPMPEAALLAMIRARQEANDP